MAEREIDEFYCVTYEGRSLGSLFVARRWTRICTLRGKIYPSMVCKLYMHIRDMPQDAYSHTISVKGVEFEVSTDVFANLLGIPRASELSVLMNQAKYDVGTSRSVSPTEPIRRAEM